MATLDGQKLGEMLTSYRRALAEKRSAQSESKDATKKTMEKGRSAARRTSEGSRTRSVGGKKSSTPDARRTLRNVVAFHALLISLLVLFFVHGTMGEFGSEAVAATVATFVVMIIVAAIPWVRLAFVLASAASWGFIAFMVVLNVWEDEEEAGAVAVVVGLLAVAALLAVIRVRPAATTRTTTGRTNKIDRVVPNDGEGRSPSNLGVEPIVETAKAPWRDTAMIQWGRRSRGSGAAIEWSLVDRRR